MEHKVDIDVIIVNIVIIVHFVKTSIISPSRLKLLIFPQHSVCATKVLHM